MIRTTETQNYLGQAACETQFTVTKSFNFTLTKGYDASNTCFVDVETLEISGASPMNKTIKAWYMPEAITEPVHISGYGFMYRCFKNYMVATTKSGYQGFTAPMQITPNQWVIFQCFDKDGNRLEKANKINIDYVPANNELYIYKSNWGSTNAFPVGNFIHNGEIVSVISDKFAGLRGLMKTLFNISGALTQYCKKNPEVETTMLEDNSEWLSSGYIMKPWGQLFVTELSLEEAQYTAYKKLGYIETVITNCVVVDKGWHWKTILFESDGHLLSYDSNNLRGEHLLFNEKLSIPKQEDGRFYFPELMKENGTYYGTLTENDELWHDHNFKSGKLTTVEIWLRD
jgi:hypothetical protein